MAQAAEETNQGSMPEIVLNADLEPICGGERTPSGKPRSDGKEDGRVSRGTCQRDAGWGTMHPGEGRCKEHGGDSETALDITISDGAKGRSYKEVVKHQRLKELIDEEESAGDLNNLDGEIVLIRAMLKLFAESFGLTMTFTETGEPDISEAYVSFGPQAKQMIELMSLLSSTLKRKFEILAISNAVIPRSTVRHYVTQLTLIAQRTLRNSCTKCGHESNQRDNLTAAWALIGEI